MCITIAIQPFSSHDAIATIPPPPPTASRKYPHHTTLWGSLGDVPQSFPKRMRGLFVCAWSVEGWGRSPVGLRVLEYHGSSN